MPDHLARPQLALDNVALAAQGGGIIVLKMPNVGSFKGLVTKLSRLWFHTVHYKHISKSTRMVGEDEQGPFKTLLRHSISENGTGKFALSRHLEVVYWQTYDADFPYRSRHLHHAYKTLPALARLVPLNFLSESALVIVMRKRP